MLFNSKKKKKYKFKFQNALVITTSYKFYDICANNTPSCTN